MIRLAVTPAALAFLAACSGGLDPNPADRLAIGTWGGENAGVVVNDSTAHVHVGCTYGNFPMPAAFDRGGSFEASGEYLLRAYPVAIGPTMPAVLAGTVGREELTFTVTVTDTVAKTTVVLGPVTVVHGREPKLGPCPICAVAPARR